MGSMTARLLLLIGVALTPLVLGAAVPDRPPHPPESAHVAPGDVPVEIGPRKLPAGSPPTRGCTGASEHCCGDGIIDPGEECDAPTGDSGPADIACRADCTLRRCGDGIVDVERGEQCDRGDLRPGDGCSARCFLEPSPTARMTRGRGPRQTECVIAWKLEGTVDPGTGPAAPRQACIDGDPRCDHDGAPDGRCRFYVWLCSNNSKPSELPCRPGAGRDGVGVVALAEVRKPTARDAARKGVDAENYRQLLAAAASAPVGSNADVCGPRIEIQVPTRTGRRGARSIRLRATSNRNAKDADALKLVGLPPGSPGPVAHATVAAGETP
jgi:cysteine-rich repeat protein